MDVMQVAELIGSSLGLISFILYFPVKNGILKAKAESDNISNLKMIVDGLKSEREDLRKRVNKLELDVKHLGKMVADQDYDLNIDKMAFNSVVLCKYGKDCPIMKKRKELKNGNKE